MDDVHVHAEQVCVLMSDSQSLKELRMATSDRCDRVSVHTVAKVFIPQFD